ncbi:hypothetical protein FA13DRAFT_1738422, partial [Coprinellus micaceus]
LSDRWGGKTPWQTCVSFPQHDPSRFGDRVHSFGDCGAVVSKGLHPSNGYSVSHASTEAERRASPSIP